MVALWVMSVFKFVIRVVLWIMSVFRHCGKGSFVDHVCFQAVWYRWLCGSCLFSGSVVKVALWIMSVFSFRQCGKGGFVDHVCFQAVW